MNEKDVSTALYGAIRALVINRDYFYDGCSPYYSRLTDHGQKTALDILNLFAPQINEAIKADALEQSKKLVFSTLKEATPKDSF